jgi:hypothetical protein
MKESQLIGNILAEEMDSHSAVGRERPQLESLSKLASYRSTSAPPVVPKNVSSPTLVNQIFRIFV